jgi:hypothetical protein
VATGALYKSPRIKNQMIVRIYWPRPRFMIGLRSVQFVGFVKA